MDHFFCDWRALMSALLHWFAGGDPYGSFITTTGATYEAGYFAYPPPVLLLGAPLALLPWWLSGLLVQAVAIIGFEGWSRRFTGRTALLWLFWPPLLQGLQIGQTTLLTLVALMWAELYYRERQDTKAGILLALALLKPQMSLLAIGYLLLLALRTQRWRLLSVFTATSVVLWVGTVLLLGPQIYAQWLIGLDAYRVALPDRPLILLPLGPLLLLLAVLLWRNGERDYFGLALLIMNLIYPLSVLYITSAVAFVVLRLRRNWEPWPLALGWLIPIIFTRLPASPDMLIASIQLTVATGLLTGLVPRLKMLRRKESFSSV